MPQKDTNHIDICEQEAGHRTVIIPLT